MARKKKAPDSGPSKAYLLSFGDTMTALCAFFIVLNSLAKEQTGANLHAGTGSFVRSLKSFGMPGVAPGDYSARALSFTETSPLYMVPDDVPTETEANGTGPDEDNDQLRVIDRETEQFERFLAEMERMSKVEPEEKAKGEVVFDIYSPLSPEPPHLKGQAIDAFKQTLPLLRRPDYRDEIIVWATTPSSTAWLRASRQAASIRDQVTTAARLNSDQSRQIIAVGRPWLYSDVKRPVFSLVVRRMER